MIEVGVGEYHPLELTDPQAPQVGEDHPAPRISRLSRRTPVDQDPAPGGRPDQCRVPLPDIEESDRQAAPSAFADRSTEISKRARPL